jgi:hypothetical protein
MSQGKREGKIAERHTHLIVRWDFEFRKKAQENLLTICAKRHHNCALHQVWNIFAFSRSLTHYTFEEMLFLNNKYEECWTFFFVARNLLFFLLRPFLPNAMPHIKGLCRDGGMEFY